MDDKLKLEEMSSFFNNRVQSYEQHMMNGINGADKYYIETAKLIPKINGLKLLDLGCGTGLELDEIFKINPTVNVTGIDLAKDMVEKIKEKHSDKLNQINLIIDSYFNYDMGESVFDVALSVETLHHFEAEQKIQLYKKIFKSLKQNGFYIETDYMAPSQEYEDYHFSENNRIRSELGITEGFYHYDTPCTVENQIKILCKAGFKSVQKVWQQENTAILLAKK
ncbi:class I SAM-dependent methyltransferase [Clostridium akagii]|uniref:class I SAM-dependent methyltransferase n=1 Tax=Clostridium akagii TaxID=91623 RepID=UPI00055AA4A9|nr:class I SAM-dependent methyltransferase [Clostridium akagii]